MPPMWMDRNNEIDGSDIMLIVIFGGTCLGLLIYWGIKIVHYLNNVL